MSDNPLTNIKAWPEIIRAVRTPIGLLVLIVLITGALLVFVIKEGDSLDPTVIGMGLIGILALLIVAAVVITDRKADALPGEGEKVSEGRSSEGQSPCEDYGVEILSPEPGQPVDAGRGLIVRGTFREKPPYERMKLFEVDSNGEYYPLKAKIASAGNQNGWQARVPAAGRLGDPLTIMVAIMGDGGRALCDYYEKVWQAYGGKCSKPITTLTPDIHQCCRVTVVRS
jgi:hypothetical protein